ncbi:hypothetical protein CPG37_07025 [Malaciobacter canalis]|uniref:Uncharacterized protein n=1 Tax=Malaciobacter canalis TaxID=1912871 RepID=A0ABX4LPD1_9BACT|nr:DUF2528 family protein [Malaciobacter canalis]PHO09762.1 hypothetical protein CPG37_07025 [Malaciobacter canalis]QEE33379.1 DUF2528 domain-containing protein [Malaciobacter canalis]
MEKYLVDFDYEFSVTIGFEDNEETLKRLDEINSFWTNSKQRLKDANGCIKRVVARLIAIQILRLQAQSSFYESEPLIKEKFQSGDLEGFYPIDGSFGMELIEVNIPFKPHTLRFDIDKQ